MTGHLDTITSDQLEGLLLDIWMSGFKSGAVSTLANLEINENGTPEREAVAASKKLGSRVAARLFEDPLKRAHVLAMISQFIHARLGITCGCGQHRTGG